MQDIVATKNVSNEHHKTGQHYQDYVRTETVESCMKEGNKKKRGRKLPSGKKFITQQQCVFNFLTVHDKSIRYTVEKTFYIAK